MAHNGTVAYVAVIPPCEIDPRHGPAYADAAIQIGHRRVWASVCKPCFDNGDGHLGLGAGQELQLPPAPEKKEPKIGPIIDQDAPLLDWLQNGNAADVYIN